MTATAYVEKLAALLVQYRRPILAAVAVLVLLGLAGMSRVSFDLEPRSVFERRGDDYALLEEFYASFGADDNDVLAVIDGAELFSAESIGVIRQLVERMSKLPGVEAVYSILNARRAGSLAIPLVPGSTASAERYRTARQRALEHPLVAGHLLSTDAQVMLVIVRLEGHSLTVAEAALLVDQLRAIIRGCTRSSNLRVQLAGHAPCRVDGIRGLQTEQWRFTSLAAAVAGSIALILFRNLAAVLITVAAPAIGVIWIVGAMGLLGEPINGLNAVLPTLVLVVGFTSAVHLMIDIRHSLAEGKSPGAAATDAIRHLALSCGLASLTTAIGFGSLMLAETQSVQRFGATCACGALLNFVAVLTVVPLLAGTWLGNHLLGSKPRSENQSSRDRLLWLVAPAINYPRLLATLGTVASLAMFAVALQLRPDIKWNESLPADGETAQTLRRCDRAFGGSMLGYVVIDWPSQLDLDSPEVLAVTRQVHDILEAQQKLSGPLSVLNMLEALPGGDDELHTRVGQLGRLPASVAERMVRRDLQQLVVSFHIPDIGAAALRPVLADVDRQLGDLQRRHLGYRLRLTGTVVVAARNVHRMIGDLGRSLGFAALVVFGVMMLAFRSVKLGLISVVPNAFPLGFTASLLVLRGIPLQITSVLTFSMCLGIAVDDTIHFLVRFQREQENGGDVCGAIQRTFRSVGAAILTTTVILVGGFSVMMISEMGMVRLFSELSCIAMVAALAGDLLILPALVLCFVSNKHDNDNPS